VITFIGSLFCGYTIKETLYLKKDTNKTKIVIRDYGCGAYDSDFPKYEVLQITKLLPFLDYVKSTDTTKLDKKQWVKAAH
jgi:hypothetical protein